MIKNTNNKMTTNSQLSTTESKKTKNKNKLSKQLEKEQNHRNGDYMVGYQCGGGVGRMGEKVQRIRSVNGRYKIHRGKLRIYRKWRSQRIYMYDPWT